MDQTFETAFERIEQILAQMNGGQVPLDESLKLFEEADRLLRFCAERLTLAEQEVECVMKGRNGELLLDGLQQPKTQPYP